MAETDNKYEWDVKAERKGFGVSKEDDKQDPITEILMGPKEHPAWNMFLGCYFPAAKEEDPEYLTTPQILDRLNAIIDCPNFQDHKLFPQLEEAGFKQLLPPPAGVFLWMVKATRMKMIGEGL